VARRVDVTRRDDLRAMAGAALDAFGRIDVLVNNAGVYRAALPTEVTEEHWDAVMAVNARGVFFASQAVLPAMLAARRGNIISISSLAGKIGARNNLPYNASKAAVISITKSLAVAYAADGVRANCVCPGLVETEMWREVTEQAGRGVLGLDPREYARQRLAQVPLGRMETPGDVAGVVGFLASSKAAYMTGQAINVTGGLIMF
jgi:3-oxoacyl-[acyl-carrier protein] reductase/meso-butanediol dehydrogenase/(S,S)-butanediol dehydrogenase/diacetyl reductase